MQSYVWFAGLSEPLINNAWKIFWGAFLIALIVAVRDTPKIWSELKEAKRVSKGRAGPTINLVLHWVAVLITSLGALASQLGSDKSDGEIGALKTASTNDQRQIAILMTNFSAATNQVAELSAAMKAAKIKPVKERIIECLNSISPMFLKELERNKIWSEGMIASHKYAELEELARDPEGSKYISIRPLADGSGGTLGFRNDGSTFRRAGVELNPSLLK